MAEESNDSLKDYKIELLKIYDKSQESFEKQLSYISAGGLGLSMAFIDKVVKNLSTSECRWSLASSWILLGLTLVTNLISHLLSARSTYKTIDDIENNRYEYEKAKSRNKVINILNYGCIGSLLVGILLLILFVIKNLLK